MSAETISTGEAIVRTLVREGVDTVFGIPGVQTYELFDALGVNEAGGAVRLGLAHYNTAEEVGYVIDSVAALRGTLS